VLDGALLPELSGWPLLAPPTLLVSNDPPPIRFVLLEELPDP
jgi:hypothetical protein